MGTFGERLQREREMRGITLEEIAEATKIGTRSLRALEQQDFDKLPGGIFNKGFVRAYSKYLGIDEDQAVADYVTAVNEAQAAGKLNRPENAPPTFEEESEKPEPVRIPWALLIIIALIVVVGFAAKSYYAQYGWSKLRREASPTQPKRQAPPPTTQPPATVPAAAAAVPAPVDAAQKQPVPSGEAPGSPPAKPGNAAAAAEPTGGFVVKVRAKEKAWVVIHADGVEVSRGPLAPNSEKEVRASKSLSLYTNNAGGIEVSHNDRPLPPLGAANEKKTVVFDAKGLK